MEDFDQALTFDDVLIVPQFSNVVSRKDVDLSFNGLSYPYMRLPIISANMDSITGPMMAQTMLFNGAQACLHRFCTIDENVKMLQESALYATGERYATPFVSIGLGIKELDRAKALFDNSAYCFVIDVAHGAQMAVVEQAQALKGIIGSNGSIIVGNFASRNSVEDFLCHFPHVDGVKVGIGPGSACTTRIKTGVGMPQLSAIMGIAKLLRGRRISVIADGGMKTPGDIAKALGAGADMVMLGGMLSGTLESAATQKQIVETMEDWKNGPTPFYRDKFTEQELKEQVTKWFDAQRPNVTYRGSASKESYEAQGKSGSHRTSEGESFLVPYKGSVKDILQDIEGGLRSSFSYVGAHNLKEFQNKVKFVRVTNAGYAEGLPHGKK